MPREASPTIRSGVFHAGTLGAASLVTTSAVAAAADLAAASASPSPSFAAIAEWTQPYRSAPAVTDRYIAATASARCEIPEAGVLASVSFQI